MSTAFNGEFATKDKRANKSIITKNSELYRYTDLREWYERHIIEPTLMSLEEFQRSKSHPYYMIVLNIASIEFPMTLKNISRFERLNGISINVYSIENKQVLPLRLPSDKKEKHVNVLYMQDPRDNGVKHFAWFARQLQNLAHHEKNIISANVPIETLSKEQWKAYYSSYLNKDKLKIFLYEYVDCVEKLQNTRLSPHELFFSSLTGGTVSESDYAHVAKASSGSDSPFERSAFSDLYLKTNVLLLRRCNLCYTPNFENDANFDASAIAPDSPIGYILKIDLEYPQYLHDRHIDLPFYSTRDKSPGKRKHKLLATLYDKQHYVIHYLRVTKIHWMLQFAQSPNFHSRRVFAENLIAVKLRKLEVKFNKQIYVNGQRVRASREQKKILSLMKDENNDAIMTEFVGLRAKMYAVRVDGKKDTKKVKGVKNNVVARTFDDYTRCSNKEIEMTRRQSCTIIELTSSILVIYKVISAIFYKGEEMNYTCILRADKKSEWCYSNDSQIIEKKWPKGAQGVYILIFEQIK
ncbi:hypothetical protein ALC56_01072 [Trachymyrmex septentrionalis]|uniref:USP domain-containing protein n=1 Tax=Trachymyrmex septentrionalis TaxID=34720 RepID=A0A151K1S1_9HYME|nr:hypothetical protein ALC56_01072 [Trachymyrmex septentrionalis]